MGVGVPFRETFVRVTETVDGSIVKARYDLKERIEVIQSARE